MTGFDLDGFQIALLDENFMQTGQRIEVVEPNPSGQGTVSFLFGHPCLRVRIPEQPIQWLKEKKAAEAVIFELRPEGVTLHIVEMKSGVNASEWDKVKRQFFGAHLNAAAMSAVLGLPELRDVTVHLAYRRDKVRLHGGAATAPLKVGVGQRQSHTVMDWRHSSITVEGRTYRAAYPQRDDDGNACVTLSALTPALADS